jgi:hypothetical protein
MAGTSSAKFEVMAGFPRVNRSALEFKVPLRDWRRLVNLAALNAPKYSPNSQSSVINIYLT